METRSDSAEIAATRDDSLNRLEETLVKLPPAPTPVFHHFTPGMYVREIHIPAGTLGTSRIHKHEHPFVLAKGRMRVSSDNEGSVVYEAPYVGITLPGTRRALLAETDCVWITFHLNPTDETNPDKIVEELTDPPDNPLVSNELPAMRHWQHNGLPTLTQ